GEVGVRRRGRGVEGHRDWAGHVYVAFEDRRRVDQHVPARLDLPLVERVARDLEAQRAVTPERVRSAVAAEVVVGVAGPGERPFPLAPPAVLAHGENLDRIFLVRAVANPLEPAVKEAQVLAVEVNR